MFFILKILSYSPIFNVVGSDKEFGDIYRSSDTIRISLFAFTIVHFYSLLSLTYNKKSREYIFEFKKVIRYPILNENISTEEKVSNFKNEIKDLDVDSLKLKLEVLQIRIDSQDEAINTSITKAGIVLPIFIALFIYILQTKIINLGVIDHSISGWIFISIILFCYVATSINLLFFLMKLSKVSSFAEILLLKSSSSMDLLQEKITNVYSKFIQNKNRSINRVSYNIWVQDYFKKFLLYASILYLFTSIYPLKDNKRDTNPVFFTESNCHAISFKRNSTVLENFKILSKIKEKLSKSDNQRIIYLATPDSLNSKRIEDLVGFISLCINNNDSNNIVIFSNEITDSNRIYLLTDGITK